MMSMRTHARGAAVALACTVAVPTGVGIAQAQPAVQGVVDPAARAVAQQYADIGNTTVYTDLGLAELAFITAGHAQSQVFDVWGRSLSGRVTASALGLEGYENPLAPSALDGRGKPPVQIKSMNCTDMDCEVAWVKLYPNATYANRGHLNRTVLGWKIAEFYDEI